MQVQLDTPAALTTCRQVGISLAAQPPDVACMCLCSKVQWELSQGVAAQRRCRGPLAVCPSRRLAPPGRMRHYAPHTPLPLFGMPQQHAASKHLGKGALAGAGFCSLQEYTSSIREPQTQMT